jgi:hypothetical protein
MNCTNLLTAASLARSQEVCVVLGLQGLADAKGDLKENDIIRKVL